MDDVSSSSSRALHQRGWSRSSFIAPFLALVGVAALEFGGIEKVRVI
jgi:hypothetical protein